MTKSLVYYYCYHYYLGLACFSFVICCCQNIELGRGNRTSRAREGSNTKIVVSPRRLHRRRATLRESLGVVQVLQRPCTKAVGHALLPAQTGKVLRVPLSVSFSFLLPLLFLFYFKFYFLIDFHVGLYI